MYFVCVDWKKVKIDSGNGFAWTNAHQTQSFNGHILIQNDTKIKKIKFAIIIFAHKIIWKILVNEWFLRPKLWLIITLASDILFIDQRIFLSNHVGWSQWIFLSFTRNLISIYSIMLYFNRFFYLPFCYMHNHNRLVLDSDICSSRYDTISYHVMKDENLPNKW